MRVAVAGTFGPLHDGHRALFRAALERGDEGVVVGLSSDEFARESRRPNPRPIPPYEERERRVESVLEELDERNRMVEIRRFTDGHGFADDDPSLDALVVSPETDDEVAAINRQRTDRGMEPLEPIVVPHEYAEDGEPISSTRIVNGEIDEHGNLRE
ncbi:pantetheine-phosphate adenylyltransferase [Halorarum halophilum]|uniref:Pantetheine-phosphate adenylyltransferase n=1 Tax=Halorarum halophilum TaxID=2743090 RepID=A0A7D5K0M5_9EURY|nr:pantetheine-phosphate adenylyltransferase [Halobaculum halophilum]QLG27041.1 pantetheine-phosphate adenylyltransferase [Halobaculum halophilum]